MKTLAATIVLLLLAPSGQAANPGDVLFSEVAWMGSDSSYLDEWIELFNASAQPVSMAGWQILEGTTTRNITAASCADGSCTVAPGAYFLIERRQEAVSDLIADAVVSLNLNNDGEPLELLDASGTRIDFLDTSSGWYAGNLTGHLTMERINPAAPSADAANWASNDGQAINGLDSGSLPIKGTPRAQNSAFDAGCSPEGAQEDCYQGPNGTAGIGICHIGQRSCTNATWSTCQNQQLPEAENCQNDLDDDCDNLTDAADADCAGTCYDNDGDGFQDQACGGPDCDDGAPAVHPNASEVCDLVDNDCDGFTDEDLGTVTCGQGVCRVTIEVCSGGQTQTCQPSTPAEATEFSCTDGLDNDCDGWVDGEDQNCSAACADADNDGHSAASCGGTDCDDSDADIHPGAPELCRDRRDNDCDGLTDGQDGDCPADCPDGDGDGYPSSSCGGSDCDDTDDLTHPGVTEICSDFIDNDCDGFLDLNDLDCAGVGGEDGGCGCGHQCRGDPLLLGWILLAALWLRRRLG